jgi:hypothetical protein
MNHLLTSLSLNANAKSSKKKWAARRRRQDGRRTDRFIRRVWPSIDDFQSNKSLRLLRTASAWLKSSDKSVMLLVCWCAMQSATSSWQVTVVGRVLTGGGHQHQSK